MLTATHLLLLDCWTVVKLKRFIERSTPRPLFPPPPAVLALSDNGNNDDDASDAPSTGTTNTNITYPDLGDWAYGKDFQSYTAACICVQQLAICTVFLSFIGENLLAVFEFLNVAQVFDSHIMVLTLALPAVLSLSFLPNLKSLAPVMAAGTVLMMIGFGALGAIGVMEWEDRPASTPTLDVPQAPLAVCAILYSYEGICLVLPVESAMRDPSQFKKAFVWSMSTVAVILASVASLSVLVFGSVNNGSITAFLLDLYRHDPRVTWWLMVANTAVSLSVLLTYPLQLFPALELMGPWLNTLSCRICKCCQSKDASRDVGEEADLIGFEPLPPLPEHDTASLGSHDYGEDFQVDEEGDSDDNNNNGDGNNSDDDDDDEDDLSRTMVSSVTTMFPELTMPGDSPQLRLMLVVLTYLVAVVVPNVQSLISLAGAVAGSSTALLIPPVLELAWIKQLQKDATNKDAWSCFSDKYLFDKVKCYLLLIFGVIFMLIGSVASISDIIHIYTSGE